MKHLWILALCIVAAAAVIIPQNERINGENGWFVPQADGSFKWLDREEVETYSEININAVNYYLYTKSNPSVAQEINATTQSIDASNFNASNPTKITIHGWTCDKDHYVNWGVRNAWLSHGDYNMITVDWARARSSDYASSVSAIPEVGQIIAAFIDYLVINYSLKLDTLQVIGHSLGAHVAGFTGKNIASGKAQSIVGLDAALPLYHYDYPDQRLSSTDANYVESIQTNGGKLGFTKPLGQGTFYPNGGKDQPSCEMDLTGACAHNVVVPYYVEAVEKNNFATIECVDYQDAVAKNCGITYSSVLMGALTVEFMVPGVYYVPVNSQAPYGVLP